MELVSSITRENRKLETELSYLRMALALDDKTNLSTGSNWVISSATYQKKKEKKNWVISNAVWNSMNF